MRLQLVFKGFALSGVVFVVLAFFMKFGSPRGDYANGPVAQRVDNEQHAAIDHPEDDETFFAIVLAVIQPLDGKRVVEDSPGAVSKLTPCLA